MVFPTLGDRDEIDRQNCSAAARARPVGDAAIVLRGIDQLERGTRAIRGDRPRGIIVVTHFVHDQIREAGFDQLERSSAVIEAAGHFADDRDLVAVSVDESIPVFSDDEEAARGEVGSLRKSEVDAVEPPVREVEREALMQVVNLDVGGARSERVVHDLVDQDIVRRRDRAAIEGDGDGVAGAGDRVPTPIVADHGQRVAAGVEGDFQNPTGDIGPGGGILDPVDLDRLDGHRSGAGELDQVIVGGEISPGVARDGERGIDPAQLALDISASLADEGLDASGSTGPDPVGLKGGVLRVQHRIHVGGEERSVDGILKSPPVSAHKRRMAPKTRDGGIVRAKKARGRTIAA